MRSILGRLLLSASLALLGCKGETGATGPQGQVGPQGDPGPKGDPGEPRTSVDGLDGGIISGSVGVTGDLTVGGRPVGYRSGPLVLGGDSPLGCVSSGTFTNGTVSFPASFAANPVVVATVDETGDDNGAIWARLLRLAPNRVGFRCGNAPADGINWLAIESGTFTISGKQVEAGVASGAVSGGSISFPTPFSAPPIVLLTVDETGDNSGGAFARVINTVTTTGFQYWLDGSSDALHWIAMEPGDYQHGRYQWTAGVMGTNNTCSTPCTLTFPRPLQTAPAVLLTINDTNNSGAQGLRIQRVTTTQLRFLLYDTTGTGLATENVFYVLLQELN